MNARDACVHERVTSFKLQPYISTLNISTNTNHQVTVPTYELPHADTLIANRKNPPTTKSFLQRLFRQEPHPPEQSSESVCSEDRAGMSLEILSAWR